jgi:hypothetical protein
MSDIKNTPPARRGRPAKTPGLFDLKQHAETRPPAPVISELVITPLIVQRILDAENED